MKKKVKFQMPLSYHSQPGGYLVSNLSLCKAKLGQSREITEQKRKKNRVLFSLGVLGTGFFVWFLWKSLLGMTVFLT